MSNSMMMMTMMITMMMVMIIIRRMRMMRRMGMMRRMRRMRMMTILRCRFKLSQFFLAWQGEIVCEMKSGVIRKETIHRVEGLNHVSESKAVPRAIQAIRVQRPGRDLNFHSTTV
ncbi:hypothetical protein DPMN_043335 [Dreissena polymorpha]|uniref:Uncharacterized protein n=1 Tax=Dreissena polymorpha TaxID=45954 RepID=A0A9D4HXV0_DREPO|nr:hypothetical protein DPMN_043335 [Dreissena polymorpha]